MVTEARFTENGFAFTADLTGGQKTGFYCDQRPNRQLAETLAGDAVVLDLFSHSGAFTLYALRGGARSVVAMESAARLNERARRHLADNALDAARVSWIEGNAFEELRRLERRFDLVVCDPPPLVRRRADLDAGARAYKDLNRQALMHLAPGGFLLTFSCSAAVDTKLFRQILYAAAVESRRRVVLLDPLAAGPDHPIGVTPPRGRVPQGLVGGGAVAVVSDARDVGGALARPIGQTEHPRPVLDRGLVAFDHLDRDLRVTGSVERARRVRAARPRCPPRPERAGDLR